MGCIWSAVFLCLLALLPTAGAQHTDALRLVQTIPLPNVEGRIDHMACDSKRGRLFVAALGNNTVAVIDLNAGKHQQSLSGFHEPQGIAYAADSDRIFIANGETGACDILDAASLKRLHTVKFSSDADNVRYDAAAKLIYVGYGGGALGIIDAATGKELGSIPLSGHPESFQLEKAGHRIFVNVPNAGHIAVVDRVQQKVIATWPVQGASANFPMALDEPHHRLFVGCRRPAKALVYNLQTGREVASIPIGGDTDDLFYDGIDKRLYVSCGAGVIDVIQQAEPDNYKMLASIPTAAGARTSFFVPALNKLCLAVPHRGSQRAEIRIYSVQP